MFELTATPIDPADRAMGLAAPEAGAAVIFEGRVRNHHLGQAVTHLEYEAFDALAQAEGEAIITETEQLYTGTHVHCVHRTGTLQIGEVAIWIGVASAHRAAGFAACRHVIEEIKRRLPVWKKEHHPDGAAEWVNCTTEAATNPTLTAYHTRQASLPEVGAAGQAKLAAARVLVVGVGGLGCPAALYLTGAGIGHLTLVDGGHVELSNLHRQLLFTLAEVGAPKVLAAAARLQLHHPAIEIKTHQGDLTATNARALVAGHDVILDCTDNFPSRFILHDACQALDRPLISAAVHRFEGTLDVFQRGTGGCLHCLWAGRTATELDPQENCAGGPVFGPAVGVLGVMQAAETLKLILGLAGTAAQQTRLVNLLDGSALTIERLARPDCPVCRRLDQLPAPATAQNSERETIWITEAQLTALGPTAKIIFLLEPGEMAPSTGHSNFQAIPAHDLAALREFVATGPVALSCRHGLRSAALARLLRAEGGQEIYALKAAPDQS